MKLVEKTLKLKIIVINHSEFDISLPKKYKDDKIKVDLLERKYAAALLKAFDFDNSLL